MKRILKIFVEYPFYGKIVVVILLVFGTISFINMQKSSFPMVETNTLRITVKYPGATPQQMDEGVTSLIENAIRGVPGIKEFTSESMENLSQIIITSTFGYDIDELLIDVKNQVDGISNFPEEAEKPIVSKVRSRDRAMYLALTSESGDKLKLNEMANRIEDDLLGSGEISQVALEGLPSNRMELAVTIDETQLRRYNLSFTEIQQAIKANNLDIHGGAIRNPREKINIVSRQRSVYPDDIEKIVVKSNAEGKLVRVGDVASVQRQYEEDPEESFIDGNPSVIINITKLETEDLEKISEFVNQYVREFNKEQEDFRIRVMEDYTENIDSQLSIFINNGLMGIVLVIILLTLLLNFRLSLWVAWGIPASFLGMFIVGSLYGITIDRISLVGMILIVGILVDDGIVIGENIFTHFTKGKSPRLAAIDGTQEVLPAIFISILTTIIAFLPLFFIEGFLEMLYAMGFVAIVCLIFSLIEGIFVLPAHVGNPKVLKKTSKANKMSRLSNRLVYLLRDQLYMPALRGILKAKGLVLIVVTGLMIITGGLIIGGHIPFTFFPPRPMEMFNIDLALKPGTNKELTKEKLLWVEEKLYEVNRQLMEKHEREKPFVKTTQINLGNAFNNVETGTHAGVLRVFLNSTEGSNVTDKSIQNALNKKIGQIPEAYKFAMGTSSGRSQRFGAPVSIGLLGYDLNTLEKAKRELREGLSGMDALYNVTDNSQLGSQEVRIGLKPKAHTLGLTQASLMRQVRDAYYGALAQRIQDGKDEIWFYVRYPEKNRETIGQMEDMLVHTPKGNYPLSTVADLSMGRSLSKINGYNGRRVIRVDAYMKDERASVTPIINEVENNILPGIMDKYPGITYTHMGQKKDTQEQIQSMVKYFGVALLIIALIVIIYFRSFRQGMMILLSIPLGVLGAIWGHSIHNEPLCMFSIWGMVALTGVIINDSVIFVSRYNQLLVQGYKVFESAMEAARSRFRPIFLTTLTTTAGLMPLILESSPEARFLSPMAISVAYGILFGGFFILLTLPIQILVSNQLLVTTKRLFGKKDITPESVEVAVINHQIDQQVEEDIRKEESGE
ncbi:MAG: efflux RND transporter permease subunit [Bacteroidales bacterium]|nr:efflux RND transporter permease subunit [Bacteroidales bacterium]MBS3775659.1 efflux RND transporter permease subunit [Bacteroidales bacterium]